MKNKVWEKQPTSQPTARPNIILFVVMLYYFVVARNMVQPYVLTPIYEFVGVSPLSGWSQIFNRFFRDLGIPVLVYLLYACFTKQKIDASFSIARLSWTNVVNITVMTLTIRVVFDLIEKGVPFLLNDGHVPMQVFHFMDIGQSLIFNAVLATIFEEAVFRGFLWGEYYRQNVKYWKIALVTGLFFGISHLGAFTMFHTTVSGIFFYAPLIYFTRSIWAPMLHHALMNGLYTVINPTFYMDNQLAFDAFMPTYLTILLIATIVLLPIAVICGKKFYYENKHRLLPEENLPTETKSFKITYWILIATMVATFIRAF